jgi:hypothetical protein
MEVEKTIFGPRRHGSPPSPLELLQAVCGFDSIIAAITFAAIFACAHKRINNSAKLCEAAAHAPLYTVKRTCVPA